MPIRYGRGRLMRGGGRGKRSFKRRMVRRIQTVTQTSKSTQTLNLENPILGPTKTVVASLVTNIAQGDARNQRERGVIFFKGVKIRMSFRNNDELPKWLNVALVQPKDPFPTDSVTQNLLNTNRFFKKDGLSTRFADYTTGDNGIEWGTDPINTDVHNVLWHMRKRLGPRFAQTTQPFTTGTGAPAYLTLSRYIKVGHKIAFATGNGDSSEQPIYLIWWAANLEEGVSPEIPDSYVYQGKVIAFFGDVKK